MDSSRASALVKQLAREEGFQACGIATAAFLEEEAPLLERWLNNGNHGRMTWMEHHFDMRLDPRKLVPGARSVVSLVYSYFPEKKLGEEGGFKIARYAYGEDYHQVIREKLHTLMDRLSEQVGKIEGRVFVDSAPVMERQWARRAGLGWLGKNSLLLNTSLGSYFFLAELIIDLALEPDAPVKDHCGTCTACMDACPTQAIVGPGVVDSKRCISYLTIELKDAIPDEFAGRMDNWIFGCDVCQEVCPWNRFARVHQEPRFEAQGEWPEFTKREWRELTEEVFRRQFPKSAVRRTGYEGLLRNIRTADGKADVMPRESNGQE